MTASLLRLFQTLRHLRVRQVLYQCWYRVRRPYVNLNRYTQYLDHSISSFPFCDTGDLIPYSSRYQGAHKFRFLSLTHSFENNIDWNFTGHGKLWNYNLQYFDYLHDPSVTHEEKQRLVLSFCDGLLSDSILPEPYPVSLRIVNWLFYYSKTGWDNAVFHECIKLQVGYLEENLEFHILANHLLENYIALYFAGIALGDTKLLDKASKGLDEQLAEQVLADGGHYESSPMYQSILLSKLILLYRQTGTSGPEQLSTAICNMLGWLQAFVFRDGKWAHVNDATEGIAPEPAQIIEAARTSGLEPLTKKISESGYRRYNAGHFELVFDAGNIMPPYQPGHAHADMLSLCLQYRNKPILVDTGLSTYQGNERRNTERGTPAHNTVSIQNKNQSDVWSAFRVGRRAKLTVLEETERSITAAHNGFRALGVTHTRQLRCDEQQVSVEDRVSAHSENATAFFHFDHNLKIEVVNNRVTIAEGGPVFEFSGHLSIEKLSYKQALGYNQLVDAPLLAIKFTQNLCTLIRT